MVKRSINRIVPFFICLSLIILFIVFGQNAQSNSKKQDNMGNDKLIKYYFEMNQNEQKIFFKNLKLVKISDSIENVKATMGEPTYDQKLVGKKGEFIARKLSYYLNLARIRHFHNQ